MSFLGICNSDPMVEILTEVLGANIVRVPEERIRPFCVVTSDGKTTTFRGSFQTLLKDSPTLNLPIESSTMTNISGKKTESVDINLGLQILGGFLKGFGIPSAGIDLSFKNAEEVSFSFNNVIRYYIDINLLGKQLTGQKIDKENPAAAIYFGDTDYQLLLVDSVITSSDFSINVDKSNTTGVKLDIPAIQSIIDKVSVGVKVETTTGYDLIFKGSKQLAFAFSCVRFFTNDAGLITFISPAEDVGVLKSVFNVNPDLTLEYTPNRVRIGKEKDMLEIIMEPVEELTEH